MYPKTYHKALLAKLGVKGITLAKTIVFWSDFCEVCDELSEGLGDDDLDAPLDMETINKADRMLDQISDQIDNPELALEMIAKERAKLVAAKEDSEPASPTAPNVVYQVYFPGRGLVFATSDPLAKQIMADEEMVRAEEMNQTRGPLTPELLQMAPRVALWLKLNRGVTDDLIGLKEDRWYVPSRVIKAEKTLLDFLLPMMQDARQYAKLAVLESRLDFAEGKIERGCRRMTGLWRMGRAMQITRATLIQALVGMALESLAKDTLVGALQAGVLSAKDFRTMHTDLANLSSSPSLREIMLHGERFFLLDSVIRMEDFLKSEGIDIGGVPRFLWRMIDADEMLRMLNAYYDQLVVDMEQEERTGVRVRPEKKTLLTGKWMALKGVKFIFGTPGMKRQAATKVMSQVWIEIMTPAVERSWQLRREMLAREQLWKVTSVVEAYRTTHGGALPPTLEALLGKRAPVLVAPPTCEEFPEAMRLTVIGDRANPEAYAIWFPRRGHECDWVRDAYDDFSYDEEGEMSGPSDEELDAIANDPATLAADYRTFDNFVLYIPISAKAKAAWMAAQIEKINPGPYESEDMPDEFYEEPKGESDE